jgi:ABC-type multidrug transport system ATPase subunit
MQNIIHKPDLRPLRRRRWTLSFQKVVANKPGAIKSTIPIMEQQALVDFPAKPQDTAPKPPVSRAEVLRVLDLNKSFRSGFLRRPIRGIQGVSFTVAKGEVFALLGHNGAGKTTTINCILDLMRPDAGEVKIFDNTSTNIRSRSRVGYLPERPYFFEHLTGRELLAFYAKLLDVPSTEQKNQIAELLEKTGMTAAADRPLRKYSKGMLQRIGLAQALIGDPDLLILDEPMSGLDPVGRREVRHLLQDLKAAGKTIILSSHIVPDVEVLADSVGIMCEGRLAVTCCMSDLANQSSYEIRIQDGDSPLGYTVLNAGNVDTLRGSLEKCRVENQKVMAVETKRSGLEDLFMQVHAERTEA